MTASVPGITPRRRRDGSIAYEAQVRRPKVDGRAVSPISRTFPTVEEALAWREEAVAAERARRLAAAPPPPTVQFTLSEFVAWWLPRAAHLRPTTARNYRDRLRLHVLPVLGDKLLTDIRASELTALYVQLYDRVERPLAHSTVAKVHAALSQVLKTAAGDDLIPANPAAVARLPRRRELPEEVQAWSAQQVEAFLTFPEVVASPLYPVFLVAFHCGLRRGELLALTPAVVSPDGPRPHLWVRRSLGPGSLVDLPKSRRSQRRLPLSVPAADALRRLKADREHGPCQAPQLFLDARGRALSPGRVSRVFSRLAARFVASPAGRAVDAQVITLHGARHSFVTNHIAAGTPLGTISQLAGHASSNFTIAVYGHLLPDHADALPALYA